MGWNYLCIPKLQQLEWIFWLTCYCSLYLYSAARFQFISCLNNLCLRHDSPRNRSRTGIFNTLWTQVWMNLIARRTTAFSNSTILNTLRNIRSCTSRLDCSGRLSLSDLSQICVRDGEECKSNIKCSCHYCNVIMGARASQITSLTIVYPNVYSGADQRKRRRSASLAFPKGEINNIPALVVIRAWRRPSDNPFTESRKLSLPTHLYVTWSVSVSYLNNLWFQLPIYIL